MSDLAPELYAFSLSDRMLVSKSALAIFEYITTLDQEVSSVWKRKPSGASFLLFAIRHTMLASAIWNVSILASLSTKECIGFDTIGAFFVRLAEILTTAFSALRIYALCGGNIRLSAVVFILQLSPFVINLYRYARSTYTIDSILGCLEIDHYSSRTQSIMIYTSRIPLTVGDAFVVIVTWIKSFRLLRMQRNVGVHLSLSTLLLSDGTAYFLILLILNVLQLTPLTSYEGGFIIGGLNASLPLILVNRFMLNLRRLSDPEMRSTGHTCTISTPMFQVSLDIVGNMGDPLKYGWEASEVDEAESEEGTEVVEETGSEIEEVRRDVVDAGLKTEGASQGVGELEAGNLRLQSV